MIFPQEGLTDMMTQVYDGNTFTMGLITLAAFSVTDTWAVKPWTEVQERTVTGSVSSDTVSFTGTLSFTVPDDFYGLFIRTATVLHLMKTVTVGNETSFTADVELKFV